MLHASGRYGGPRGSHGQQAFASNIGLEAALDPDVRAEDIRDGPSVLLCGQAPHADDFAWLGGRGGGQSAGVGGAACHGQRGDRDETRKGQRTQTHWKPHCAAAAAASWGGFSVEEARN